MPVFLNNICSPFINNLSKCFFCCCKVDRYTEQSLNERSLSNHNKYLLDREYLTLKKHKINANSRLYYQRITDTFEQILFDNLKNLNVLNFQSNTRQSLFGNHYNNNNNHTELFIKLSESVYSLIKNKKLLFTEKTTIIRHFISSIENLEDDFNEEQILFATEIFLSIYDYFNLDEYIKKTIKYNIPNNYNIYQINIHDLFIAGKTLYKDFKCYKHNIDNKGPFVIDYNYKYIERCVRAFGYMLQNRMQSKDKPITLSELKNVNSIFGGSKGITKAVQYFQINKDSSKQIIQLLSLGIVSSEVINSDNTIMKYSKQKLKDIILFSSGILVSFNDDSMNQDSYRLSPKHFDMKTYNSSKEYLKNIDEICNTGNLLQSLSGVNEKPAFQFKICMKDDGTYISMQYIYDMDKLSVIEQLLKSYYIIIKDIDDDLEKVRIMIWLCNTLEIIHPFSNANSRTLFYVLLPILLYQQNFWLTKTLYDSKETLSFFTPAYLAEKVLNLCVPLNYITIMQSFNWLYKSSHDEIIRIACAIGDIKKLEEVLDYVPSLIGQPIIISAEKQPMPAVEFALRHGQAGIAKYLLQSESWQITTKQAKKMYSDYLKSDEYYYNLETPKLLNELIMQE